jgi:hypothetical protein
LSDNALPGSRTVFNGNRGNSIIGAAINITV